MLRKAGGTLWGHVMPIMAAEKSRFPDDVLAAYAGLAENRIWWIAYTRPRQEKRLARDLLHREIPFYLPLVGKSNLIRGRRVTSYLPLFPSYVFLHTDERERMQSVSTNRIVDLLRVPDGPALREDLAQVERLIESDSPLTVESRLQAGQGVRIRRGPLAGLEGEVISRRHRTRLLVSVRFLNQGVSLEIDDFLLEALR